MPRTKKYLVQQKKKEEEKKIEEEKKKEEEFTKQHLITINRRRQKSVKEANEKQKRIVEKRNKINMSPSLGRNNGGYNLRYCKHPNPTFRVSKCKQCCDGAESNILTYIAFTIIKASAYCVCTNCADVIYDPMIVNDDNLVEINHEPDEIFPNGVHYFKHLPSGELLSPEEKDELLNKTICSNCYQEITKTPRQLQPGKEGVIIDEICKTMFTLYFNEKHVLVRVEVEGGQMYRYLNPVYTEFDLHIHNAVELLLATYFQDFKFIDKRLRIMQKEFGKFNPLHETLDLKRMNKLNLYPGEQVDSLLEFKYDSCSPCWCCGRDNDTYHGCDSDKIRSKKGAYLMIVLPMIYKLDFDKSFDFHFYNDKWTFYYNSAGYLSMTDEYHFMKDQYSSWYRSYWYLHCSIGQEQPWLIDDLDIEVLDYESSDD